MCSQFYTAFFPPVFHKSKRNNTWVGCKALYARATGTAKSLGQYNYVRNHPVPCRLVLIKRIKRDLHKKSKWVSWTIRAVA